MTQRTIEFDRIALHRQVWAQPLAQVALLYGATAAETKAAALALSIPLPSAGHWTKVEHGKAIATPVLPAFSGETTHRLTKWVDEHAERVASRYAVAQASLERQANELPQMRTALADCLPIIKRMALRLKKGYKDARLWPSIIGMGQFEIGVAPPNQERALLTLDRILRHCEAAGLRLTSDETKREPAVIEIDGVSFTMRIFEPSRRVERELTAREKAGIKENPNAYHYLPNRYVFNPTNVLRLEVQNPKYRSVEFTLQDSSDTPLADRIGDVPRKLREPALREKISTEVRNEERLRAEERRQAHEDKVEAKRNQLARLKHFEEVAEQMERASRLRTLADAMEASASCADVVGKEKLAWIRNAADWLDPVVNQHWAVVDDVEDSSY